ncbi:oligosaccharide flippase family protein, partial [Nostoc sp. NIES-2111]
VRDCLACSLLRRWLQAKQSQTIFLAGYALCYGLVGIPAAMAGAGPWALLGAYASHSVFHLLVSWRVARCPWRPKLKGDIRLVTFGLRVTVANMGNWASENIDRFLISRFWGSAALGAYGAAANLSRAPAYLITGSLQTVAFASASRVQQSPEVMRASFLAMLNVMSVLTWPALVAMAVLADPIIHLLYGERWVMAGPLFCAFSLALIPATLLSIIGPLLWAVNRVAADVQGQVIAVAVLLAGLTLCATRPLEQAVWVVLVAYLLRSLWMGCRLAMVIGVSWGDALRAVRGGVVLCALAAFVAEAVRALPAAAAIAMV